MDSIGLLVVVALLGIPLAGCMDVFSEERPEPTTHEFTLEVRPGTSDTIALYEMNDGGDMRVVAMGFMTPDQDTLTVPNPEIRVREGDTVRLRLINNNPLPHTIHLHGGLVDWEMDGVPFLNQMPVEQGQEFLYVFEDLKAGTYFYHCHVDTAHHVDLGMYGAFVVEEHEPQHDADREYVLMLDEWDNCHVHGNLDPVENSENNAAIFERQECMQRFLTDNVAQNQAASPVTQQLCDAGPPPEIREALGCDSHGDPPPGTTPRGWWPMSHPVYAPEYNTYLINGKAFPDTEPIVGREGERIRLRLVNVGEQMHSMHLHGHSMLVTHRDGYALPDPFRVDTLGIMPGERYDVVIALDNPGLWLFHDHVSLHMMNDHQDPGGMATCIAYQGFRGTDAASFARSLECVEAAMALHGDHGHA